MKVYSLRLKDRKKNQQLADFFQIVVLGTWLVTSCSLLSSSLFLFWSQKEQVSLWIVPFFTHTNNHNKSTTLADCAFNLCDCLTFLIFQTVFGIFSLVQRALHFSIWYTRVPNLILRLSHLHGVDIHIRCLLGFHDHILFYTP